MSEKHIFAIGSRSMKPQIEAYVKELRASDYDAESVFDLIKGRHSELSIRSRINKELELMRYTLWPEPETHLIWDGYSVGTYGDICVALAQNVKVIIIYAPVPGLKEIEQNPAVRLVEELRKKSAKTRLLYLPQIKKAGL